jgi:hypothetical protein
MPRLTLTVILKSEESFEAGRKKGMIALGFKLTLGRVALVSALVRFDSAVYIACLSLNDNLRSAMLFIIHV